MEEWRRRSKEKIEKKTAVRDVFLFERLKEEMKDGDEELPPKVRTTTKEGTSKVISLLDKRMKESDSAVFLLLFLFVSSLLLSSLHLRINQVYCQVKGNMTNTSLLNHQDCPPHSVSSSFFAQSLSSSGRESLREEITHSWSFSCSHMRMMSSYSTHVTKIHTKRVPVFPSYFSCPFSVSDSASLCRSLWSYYSSCVSSLKHVAKFLWRQ